MPSALRTVRCDNSSRLTGSTGSGALDVQLDLLTDHHLGQLGLIGILCGNVTDILTLAQNGHTVADGQHLMQLVGNDDDRLAVRLHVADDAEELFGLLRGQNRRRLVQNQNIRAAVKAP